jgi:hypothetical protein
MHSTSYCYGYVNEKDYGYDESDDLALALEIIDSYYDCEYVNVNDDNDYGHYEGKLSLLFI